MRCISACYFSKKKKKRKEEEEVNYASKLITHECPKI
jgi:hypothetical protein